MQEIIICIGAYILLMGGISIYKFSTTKRDDLKAFYKKKLIRGSILTALLIVVLMVVGMLGRNMYGVGMGGSVPVPYMVTSSIPTAEYYRGQSKSPDYYGNNNGTVSDTRDFTKKSFSSVIKTRAVEDIAKKVETLIKTSGGRIDSSNVSEKYASFSFVIPKTNFDAFETQMRSFVSKKLYSQTVTSQNLLGEKQNLERNQNTTQETIASTKKQRDQIEAEYTAKVNGLKNQITDVKSQILQIDVSITKNESAINTATDQNNTATLQRELNNLSQTRKIYNQRLVNYNAEINTATENFKSQMSGLGTSLDSLNTTLTNLGVQETKFLDNVETVHGSVSINLITVWELLNIYSPVNLWVVVGIIILVGRLYLLKKEEEGLKTKE